MKTFLQTSSLQVNENLPKKILGKCEVKCFLGINKRLLLKILLRTPHLKVELSYIITSNYIINLFGY